METDLVSWLPPKHPKAVPSESATKLREKLMNPSSTSEKTKNDEEKDDKRRSSKSRDKERDYRERDEKRHKHDDRDRRKRSRKDDIDPMDPAAYSDVPQGTWSDGLENSKKADSTASGALYQQRPYPAPGEVLANNKHSKSKKSVNFGSVSYSS